MITIKIPYTTSEQNALLIRDIRQQYSCVVRYAYNRFHEGKKEKEVRELCRHLNNISLLNSWLLQCAVLEGKSIQSINKDNKVIFGGKKNFYMRSENKISKEQFKEKRLQNITSQGQKNEKGNRLFDLIRMSHNEIIFKLSRKQHLILNIKSLNKNYASKINLLEKLCLLKSISVSIKLSEDYIFLIFEEQIPKNIHISDGIYMGIDLNPNYIGVSILEKQNILYTTTYDFSKLTLNLTKKQSREKIEHLNNKLNYETIICVKDIINLVRKFNVKFVFIEKLNIPNKDQSNGHLYNRLIKYIWKRNCFEHNISKRLSYQGVKIFKVNPNYSSLIGNCQYNYFDPCNAACEIARRGYNLIILKNKKFFPTYNLKKSFEDQLKEYSNDIIRDWLSLFVVLKNLNLSIEFLLSIHRSGVLS